MREPYPTTIEIRKHCPGALWVSGDRNWVVVYLGACEEPGKSWGQPNTRNSYKELLALRESLCFALEITDYRDYLGVSNEFYKPCTKPDRVQDT